ncbi:S8 family serine peptidase [Pseudoalteromonas luteoviolacea]|uniref:Cadherin domain-containing protein n=1 Tax=Pseudoalteromonas luteoviolacea DSM 6061 TaxID=1365250 RepID=A0A166XF49_9GAMM|nr:S8 family serine peptidase [Pseudoalteromonas luteoviolacea]KZN40254.1 hypothetical protein N475_12365 [Pseudoalteromonas luteoviolacea DSM 6061]MBE0387966.1 hypothetical protein [Pseudoalteromonas luteoviolacea DSM 6061]
MAKYSFKATAVAMAVSGALTAASASAATLETNTRSVNTQAAKVEQSAKQEHRAEAFLVVLKQETAADLMARGNYSTSDARSTVASVEAIQSNVKREFATLNADIKVVGSTKLLASTLIVEASDAALEQIKQNANVARVLPLYDYELHVADANDYIKGAPVNLAGFTGKGQKVAVLDTGIDYTHKVFNPAAGTKEAYEAAQADPRAVEWPQGQVKGGYDFMRNDPDPIESDPNFPDPTSPDDGASSHGTSVSHSVTGIAPDVELYVYSVCGGGCPFAAQLGALEAAMDPNGDGDISDRVDVINMSLGGEFGSTDRVDGTQFLIHQAVKMGTNVVISAGNDGNHPFRIGGPSTTPNALSVGAMGHPTINELFALGTIDGKSVEVGTAGFGPQDPFSFSNADTELVYPDANQNGCEAFGDDVDFTGKAVLIDRGACAFVTKALNAQAKGAKYVIIANNVAGGAPGLGGTSDEVTVPTISVTLDDGAALKATLAAGQQPVFTFGIESHLAIDTVADFSSRGPSMDGLLKPEITAPGVNIQVAATGTQDQLAGATGTSFSGPITAGAVALVREARPELSAAQVKAVLMNTANLDVFMEPKSINANAELAPISLIGAGLVDVEKAVASQTVAWVHHGDYDTTQAALSFGFDVLEETTTYTKTVFVKNFAGEEKTYNLRTADRYASDTALGATSWEIPASVTVGAGETASFQVKLTIDPSKLPAWSLPNPQSANDLAARAASLTLSELDGALIFDDQSTADTDHDIHMVYHVLPRANEGVEVTVLEEGDKRIQVTNNGFTTFNVVTDQLVAVGQEASAEDKQFNILSSSFNVYGSSTCDSGAFFTASMALRDELTMHRQAGYRMALDVNYDGVYDFFLQNYNDVGRSAAVIGRARTLSGPIVNGEDQWQFLTAMFHEGGSNTITFTGCSDLIGLDTSNLGDDIMIQAQVGIGNYQSGIFEVTDTVTGHTTFATAPASLVDADGNAVESLAPGASAFVDSYKPFTLASDDQILANITADMLPAVVVPVIADVELEVSEDAPVGHVIGQLALAEQDGGAELSAFEVVAQSHDGIAVSRTGEVTVSEAGAPDYDAGVMSVELTVVAYDAKGFKSEATNIIVDVMNAVDEEAEKTPVVAEGQEFDVQENAESGTVIGMLEFMDQDDNVASFKVEGSSVVAIDAEGKITVAGEVDFDQGASFEVTVTAVDADGLESEAVTVVFNVEEDELEGKPMIEEGQSFNIEENSPIGTAIGTIAFSDFDNDVTEFVITGTTLVSVNADGQLSVAGNLDFEFDRQFSFDIMAKDAKGKYSEKVRVEVRLIDVAEDNGDDDDSGSLAWLTLLAAPFAALRRRKQK